MQSTNLEIFNVSPLPYHTNLGVSQKWWRSMGLKLNISRWDFTTLAVGKTRKQNNFKKGKTFRSPFPNMYKHPSFGPKRCGLKASILPFRIIPKSGNQDLRMEICMELLPFGTFDYYDLPAFVTETSWKTTTEFKHWILEMSKSFSQPAAGNSWKIQQHCKGGVIFSETFRLR